MAHSLQLWRDRRGRVSGLRVLILCGLLAPLALAVGDAGTVGLGPRPLEELIHRAGFWALVFLFLSLAVTPFRRVTRFGQLNDVRRMIGVGAFVYAGAHFLLFVLDQELDLLKVGGEIATRLYLTVGFVGLLGLGALAATSTDGMVRRLGGRRWRRLHQLTYVIGLLALVHFFQQTKADITVPAFAAGLLVWLLGYRLLARLGPDGSGPTVVGLAALAIVAAVLTFVGEAVGIGIAFGVSPLRVLSAALDPSIGIRPGWYVLGAGLAVVVVDLLCRRRSGRVGTGAARLRPSNVPADVSPSA